MAKVKRQKHLGFVDGHRENHQNMQSGTSTKASARASTARTARPARIVRSRPASTTPQTSSFAAANTGSKWRSSGAQTPAPRRPERPERPQTSRTAKTPRNRMSVVLRQRTYDINANDVMKSAKSSQTWNKRLNNRWLNGRHQPADPPQRPATSLGIHERPESRAEALHVASELDKFDLSLINNNKSRVVGNMFRLRSGASKQARNIKMRKAMHGFGM